MWQLDPRVYGTKVRNPSHQSDRPGYTRCPMCGLLYTKLGISRHWGRCPSRPTKIQPKE